MNIRPPTANVSASLAMTRVRQNIILATCCLSLLIVGMDITIVNVALPDMQHDLDATLSGLQWVIDAYTIVMAAFLMLGGTLADRFGRRRIFQAGIVLFSLSSLLCSLANSLQWLVVARVLQALGGSMMNPVALSIIVHTFSESKERARAIGVWGATAGFALALGPLAGGLLTETFGWHAIFWINVPIGLLALWLTARYVPESRATIARRLDPIGQMLLLSGLAVFVYAVIASVHTPVLALVASILAAFIFAFMIAYERHRDEPLLNLRFFHSLPFSAATVIAVCMFTVFGGFLFLNSLYLQEIRGLSAFGTGLCILPTALAVMIVSPLSGRLVGSHGARPSLVVSGSMLALSALLLSQITVQTPLFVLLPIYALFGIGFGMVNAPIGFNAVSGMPRARAGLASAIASTCRQIGVSLGVALAGVLTGGNVSNSPNGWTGLQIAMPIFWWISAGCGLLIVALGFLSTGARARASTARIAHLLSE